MATDGKLVQGEVDENPGSAQADEATVRKLLDGLLQALLDESGAGA